jgi:hypothetical protein
MLGGLGASAESLVMHRVIRRPDHTEYEDAVWCAPVLRYLCRCPCVLPTAPLCACTCTCAPYPFPLPLPPHGRTHTPTLALAIHIPPYNAHIFHSFPLHLRRDARGLSPHPPSAILDPIRPHFPESLFVLSTCGIHLFKVRSVYCAHTSLDDRFSQQLSTSLAAPRIDCIARCNSQLHSTFNFSSTFARYVERI